MTETALYAVIAGLFGLLIGSFLNVCIYRWTHTPWDLVINHFARTPDASKYDEWFQATEPARLDGKVLTVVSRAAVLPDQSQLEARINAFIRTRGVGVESVRFIAEDHPVEFRQCNLSVVRPRSACPACNQPIAWYDNIPVLSFLLLRGRCRHCQEKISWTYPAVELLTGLFFAWFVAHSGPNLTAAKDCLFAAFMIGLIFSDLETLLLPDEFTIGGFFAGLALSLFVPLPPTLFGLFVDLFGMHLGLRFISLGEALAGALIPSGAMWFLGWCFEKIKQKEYLGFGDVKMIAMMGAFLGLSGVVVTLLLASVAGSVIGLAYLKITRKDPATHYFPFASFMGAAALIVVAANGGITGWYEHMLR